MNLQYHIYKSRITCPYCNKECEDIDYTVADNMDDRTKCECEHCGKYFHAEACIVYNTHSDCELNGKKHDFKVSKSFPTVFNCKKCSQRKIKFVGVSENE